MYDLLYSAAVGDLGTVQRCLDRASRAAFLWGDLKRSCGRGRLALHYSALGGHIEVVRELLDAGDEVKDTQDCDGISALMLASGNGHAAVVELLLKRYADKHKKDSAGLCAAHHAAKSSQQECLDLLLDAGSHLLEADAMGQLLIHFAAINGDVEMAESLLTRGCPMNGGDHHVLGETPLHIAVKYWCALIKLKQSQLGEKRN